MVFLKFTYKKNNTKLGFSTDILNSILTSRGVNNPQAFLNLTETVIEDYNNYTNIELAGEILLEHINKNSKIAILIDFDFDGYGSGAELYLYLKEICNHMNKEFNVDYLIHSKKSHGLDDEIMLMIEKGNYNLVLIPDAGSNNIKEHQILSKNNIDVICLDHHECDTYSPYACIVNNQMSAKVKNKAMTGVGVVYKFCKWLDNKLNISYADNYLDLVAVAMIADSCDLKDLESRYLVLKGLKQIEDGSNHNKFMSRIYKEKAFGMNNKVTIMGVAFYICPTVNCIIRGGDYETKINLFKAFIGADDIFVDKIRGKGEVEMCAEDYMIRMYTKLKKKQDKIVQESVELLANQIEEYNLNNSEIMIINGQEIEDSTYNRVVVNKLSERYKKHAIILRPLYTNIFGGSATGCRNKEIDDFKQWSNDTGLFKLAEGHKSAFGVQISSENINKLYELISHIPSSNILTYTVDGIFDEKTINKSMIILIGSFDYIWGNKLDEPIFTIENITIDSKDISLMGKTKTTIKFSYDDIEFIKFKTTEDEYNDIIKNDSNKFTIICKFKTNVYNGTTKAQVLIEDYYYEKSDKGKKFKF
jgi:single-stranded-DNA-specific exonuclease